MKNSKLVIPSASEGPGIRSLQTGRTLGNQRFEREILRFAQDDNQQPAIGCSRNLPWRS